MPRGPRRSAPGMCHHVMARGNARAEVFVEDVDRSEFLAGLGRVAAARRWTCLGYCLMGTHFHLLLSTAEADLSEGMRDLLAGHARRFNRRHGRVGHLFRERFLSVDVTSDEQLHAVLRYLAMNPVEAGLAASPREWIWSSYAATAGFEEGPDFLAVDAVHSLLDGDRAAAQERFRDLVAGSADGEEMRPLPTGLRGDGVIGRPRIGLPAVEDLLAIHGPEAGPAVCVALGHPQAVVAAVLGISPQALNMRLRRARSRAGG